MIAFLLNLQLSGTLSVIITLDLCLNAYFKLYLHMLPTSLALLSAFFPTSKDQLVLAFNVFLSRFSFTL